MKQTLLILLAITIVAIGCKRKDIGGDLKNRRDILESKNWKLVSLIDNGGKGNLPACQDDNYYVFMPSGEGRYEEGAVNCLDSTGTGTAPTYTGFLWEMSGDLRSISFLKYGGDPANRFDWEIRNMTYEELRARRTVIVSGVNHQLEMVLKAIDK